MDKDRSGEVICIARVIVMDMGQCELGMRDAHGLLPDIECVQPDN